MTRRSPPRELERRRHPPAGNTLAALLAIFALCVRLAWPAPPVATTPSPDFALKVALGEHALCLAAATGDDKARLPTGNEAPAPGEHADHDGLGCCLWHAAADTALPQGPITKLIVFFEGAFPGLEQPASMLRARLIGRHQARAPPQTA